jgi:hypothetical protein
VKSYYMTFIHEIIALSILNKSLLSDSKTAFKAAGRVNIMLHSSEGLNTLNVKCFRPRV